MTKFTKNEEYECAFKAYVGDDVLDYLDWQSIKPLVDFSHHFYERNLRIVSSQYVTANSLF